MFQFVPKRGSETGVPKSLLTRFDLFKKRPELVASGRYTIKSDVDPDVFALLMTRVYGGHSDVGVTRENAEQLRTLCDELGFSEFDDEIRGVLGCGDWKVRKEIAGVRDRVDRHDVLIEQLQRRVLELERRLQEVPQRVDVVEMRLQETDRGLDGPRNGVREDVEKLRREVRGGVADARAVSEEAKRLKEAEAKRAMAAPPPPCPVARPAPAAKTPGDVQGQVVGEFVYDKASPLEGIIAHLTRECGGNVQEAGIVEVTASGCIGGLPENVAELGTDSYFQSGREPDSWIRYDFKERRVTPTCYSVWECGGCSQPRSWVLEISNDGSDGSWDVVDRRDDNFLLNASYVTRNFAISAPPSRSFRFVRLRQTGKNHRGYDDLCLTSLEVFGTLHSPPSEVAMPAPAAKPLPPSPRVPGDVQGQVVGEFVYDKASPLEGIIAHLTRECGGNVQEAGIVEVTASRCVGGLPENVAELGTNSFFQSGREPDSWIRYDFKERRVTPTSYSVRAHGCSQPRSWVLEISNDGSDGSWDVVDRRDDNFLLNASYATRNFAISAPASGSFRFVRLRQTGKNHRGYDGLCLTSLEVFGTLFSQ